MLLLATTITAPCQVATIEDVEKHLSSTLEAAEEHLVASAAVHKDYCAARQHVLAKLHPTPLPTHADSHRL